GGQVGLDLGAVDQAPGLDQPPGDAAREAPELAVGQGGVEAMQRLETAGAFGGEEGLDALGRTLAGGGLAEVAVQARAGLEGAGVPGEGGDLGPVPGDRAVGQEVEGAVL